MKSRLGLTLIALLVAAPAMSADVTIDYDQNADLSSYKTFQYMQSKDATSGNQLMDQRIVEGLEAMLVKGGLKKVDANPDLVATYHVTSQDQTQYTTVGMGMGYGRGLGWGRWGGMGMGGMATTTEQTYTEGTLIVDLWEPGEKKQVWRGSSEQTLKGKPDKIANQIDKAFDKMLAKWEKMKK